MKILSDSPGLQPVSRPRSRSGVITKFLARLDSVWARLGRRQLLSCVFVTALTLAARSAILPVDTIPKPAILDEFSYILGGETLASGRLSNPTHPLWRFFETYHINMQPTYVSKYPPGQAAFLALGIVLFGKPWYGVLISVALMCGCICWMLQGWLPAKFGLLGGLLAFLQFGLTHYWMDSYWGGAVAGIGGALVFGAVPRLAHRGSVSAALAAATGIAILANSRPFEGLVMVLLSFAVLVMWPRGRVRVWLRVPVLLAFTGVLAITAGEMAYYNYRTTGSPVTFAYSINYKRYAAVPVFWIFPPYKGHREYRDPSMRWLWETWSADDYVLIRHDPLRAVKGVYDAICTGVGFGSGLVMVFFAIFALPLIHLPRLRLAAGALALFLCAMLLNQFASYHYLAPALGAYYVVAMFGLRLLNCATLRGQKIGRTLTACGLALAVILFVFDAGRAIDDKRNFGNSMARVRAQVLDKLGAASGKQLVLVRYSPEHNAHQEYVFNGPNIDAQKIVWAFDFGPNADKPLLDYYHDREVWLFQPDKREFSLEPYSRN